MNWQIHSDQGDPGLVSISDVCEATGLSPRTLRYYEEVGLLPGVRRREGGRRAYGADELERLSFIQRLKALGLSLAEIKELNAIHGIHDSTRAMLERLDELLGRRLEDLDGRIAELSALRDEMDRYRGHVARRVSSLGERGAARRSRGGRAADRRGGRAAKPRGGSAAKPKGSRR